MPSLAEIVMLGGQQRADSMRRLADLEYNRDQQRSQGRMLLGMNLAQLGANTATGIFQGIKADKLAQAKLLQDQTEAAQRKAAEDERIALEKRRVEIAEAEAAEKARIAREAQAREQQQEFASASANEKGTDGIYRMNPTKLKTALDAMGKGHLLPGMLDGINKYNQSAAGFKKYKDVVLAEGAWNVHQAEYNPAVINEFADNAVANELMSPAMAQAIKSAPPDKQKQLIQNVLATSEAYGAMFKPQAVGGHIWDPLKKAWIEEPTPPPEPAYRVPPGKGTPEFLGNFPANANFLQAPQPSAAASLPPITGTVSAARPDAKTGNIIDPKIGLTPNAVYQAALQFALTQSLPAGSRAMAAMPAQRAIQNQAAAIADAAGVDMGYLKQEYAAASASTRAMTGRYQFVSAAAAAANENIAYALELSPGVDRSQIPKLNRFTQWLTSELGGQSLPQLSQFELAIYTAAREYAKVTTGAAASIAELSVSASAKVDQLINASQTPDQFKAVTQTMQRDMANITAPLLKTIQNVNDVGPNLKRFLDFVGQSRVAPPPPTGGAGRGAGGAGNGQGTVWTGAPPMEGRPGTPFAGRYFSPDGRTELLKQPDGKFIVK